MKIYKHEKANIGIFDVDLTDGYIPMGLVEAGEVAGGEVRYIRDDMVPDGGEHAFYVDGQYVTATGLINIILQDEPHALLHQIHVSPALATLGIPEPVTITKMTLTGVSLVPGGFAPEISVLETENK